MKKNKNTKKSSGLRKTISDFSNKWIKKSEVKFSMVETIIFMIVVFGLGIIIGGIIMYGKNAFKGSTKAFNEFTSTYNEIVDRIIADLIMAENMLSQSEIQWIKTLLNDSRIKDHVLRILNNLPDTDEEQYEAQYEKLVQEHQEEIAKVTREFSRKLSELLTQYLNYTGYTAQSNDEENKGHRKRILTDK